MRNTIKPFGKSLGIIALLVMALVFGFAVLASCETGADGKDGTPAQLVYIDEDGFWIVDGQRYKDPLNDNRYVRAYMREPEAKDFDVETNTFKSQLNQTYGNVKEITLNYLPGMSQGDLSFNYKFVDEDGVEAPSFIFSVDPITGDYGVDYYTSPGLDWADNDGKADTQRTDGVFTNANKIVELDPGTYRIYFNISRDNRYFYSANNVPIPGDTLLTVSAAEVKATDFAFINTYFYTGAGVESAKIVKPNRKVLEDISVDVFYYPAGEAEITPMGGTPVDVAKGPYGVKVDLTIPAEHQNKWYALDADGNKVYTVSKLPMKDRLTILPRYPVPGDYTYPNRNTIEAYKLREGVTMTLETPDLTIVPAGTGPHWSSGAREIKTYQRAESAEGPAYGPSRTPPVMPGTYEVTFHVGLPIDYPTDKNWNETDVTFTEFILLTPNLSSIAAFKTWLYARPSSTDSPDNTNLFYSVKIGDSLDSSNGGLGGDVLTADSLGNILKESSGRAVKLDLTSNTKLEEIEEKAFSEVKNLWGIKLPAELTTIKEYAFNSCINLAEVDFGGVDEGSLTTIERFAFVSAKFKSIVFPRSFEGGAIGANAFQHCDLLESITIPNGVTIDDSAFASTEFKTKYGLGHAGIYTKSTTNVWTRVGDYPD